MAKSKKQNPDGIHVRLYDRTGSESGRIVASTACRGRHCGDETCIAEAFKVAWEDGELTRQCRTDCVARPDGNWQVADDRQQPVLPPDVEVAEPGD